MTTQGDGWELLGTESWPTLPPRSTLVGLAPLGLGTPFRESLSSYFLRLADAHSLQPATLAWEIVFPDRAEKRSKFGCTFEATWKYPYFDGLGDPTQVWVSRLEALTMVDGLGALTMGFLRERISLRGLVCKTPRWCPACFREDRENGTPFGRLLWSFEAVSCCPKHGTRLVEQCGCDPGNSKALRKSKRLPHICIKCARNLGEVTEREEEVPKPYELRRAKLIAELLTSDLCQGNPAPKRDIADFLADSVSRHAKGSAAGFGRLLGVSKTLLHGWIHRDHLPDFSQIVTIADVHGCSISDVICGRSEAVTRSPYVPASERSQTVPSAGRKRINRSVLSDELNAILVTNPPIHMREVGARLGVADKTLRVWCPELCRAISARWLESEKARTSMRRLELAGSIRDLARKLASKGIRPTHNRIRKSFPQAGRLFGAMELIQAICQEVCGEFGFR